MLVALKLQEARGGEVVIREGVVSQQPVITAHPGDAAVSEGSTTQFNVTAMASLSQL